MRQLRLCRNARYADEKSDVGEYDHLVLKMTDERISEEGIRNMKVVVDFDLCESNAVCMGIAPEVFEVRDDDFLYVLQEEPAAELHDRVREAADRCPKQAISLVE